MKKITLIAAGFAVLLIASCKKSDTDTIVPVVNAGSNTGQEAASAKLSAWQSVELTGTNSKTDGNLYSGSIEDLAITADILNSGLVLLYDKTAEGMQPLPYMQKGNIRWHYDVVEGAISINADAAGNTITGKREFSYVILSTEQLNALEAKGLTKSTLINMDYTTAAGLFD